MPYGSFSAAQRRRGYFPQEAQFGAAIPAAGRVASAIAAGRPEAPAGQYGALEAPVVGGIQRLLQPGISAARYARGRSRITKGFGAQTGRLATGGARRGYFSRGGVATGASGQPSAALAQGLGQYEVGIEREESRQLEAGLAAAGQFREDIGRFGEGYGAFAGEFARGYQPSGYSNRRRAGRAQRGGRGWYLGGP